MLPAIGPSGSVRGEQLFLAGYCQETISIADLRYRTFDCDVADRGCAIQSFVVQKRSVFNRIDAGADGPLCALGSMGVGSGLTSKSVRFVH